MDAAYAVHPTRQRILRGRLETHRAGFRHAVGDGDLTHMHLADHAAHHLDGTRRAGHDAGAQRAEIETRKFGMFQFRDEHRRHAVQAGATFFLHGFQRGQHVEAFARDHHAGAVRDAGEVAQHHAEAVIERHRNAQAIVLGEAHRRSDEKAVVDDVVVGERGALGCAGGARGELDIHRIVEIELAFHGTHLRHAVVIRTRRQLAPASRAGRCFRIQQDHFAQRRQPFRLQCAHLGHGQLGRQLHQQVQIVRGLEAAWQHQGAATHLVQRVLQFVQTVGRIDVDQDHAELRRSELQHHPLVAIRRPDADAVAPLQSQREQTGGDAFDFRMELPVVETDALGTHHQCRPIRMRCRDAVQQAAHGIAEQRLRTDTMDVAGSGHEGASVVGKRA